ncbi:MAG: DUF4097 family beta strand repeat-containing protein [Oscillospiraceae bacterium]
MKKSVKVVLIVAASLFCAGLVISTAALALVHFDFSRLNAAISFGETQNAQALKAERVDKTLENDGKDVIFNLSSAEVVILPSPDDKIHLSYSNTENIYFELEETENEIRLLQKTAGSGHLWFVFNFNSEPQYDVNLLLPKTYAGALNLSSTSGGVNLRDLAFEGDVRIELTSGEIVLENVDAKTIFANNSSGEVSVANVKTQVLNLASISGDVSAVNSSGTRTEISTTAGEIELSRLGGKQVKLDAVSGDIEGTVLGSPADYTVHSDTVSGENNLSEYGEKGENSLDIKTVSGDIEIYFEAGVN